MSTGNLLVAVVVLRGSRTMRRCVTNLFLVNLAFADLLVVLACLPFTLVAHLIYRKWISFFFCLFRSVFHNLGDGDILTGPKESAVK